MPDDITPKPPTNHRNNPDGNRGRWPFQPILTHLLIPIVCRCISEWVANLLDRWDT